MTDAVAANPVISALVKPKVSLRRRILLVLLLAGVPGIIVAVFLTVQKFAEETRQIETSVTRLAALGAAQHENVLTNASTLLEALVKPQRLETIGDADCTTYLKGWSDKLVHFSSLTLFDTTGQVVCTNISGELPYGAGESEWFANALQDQRFTVSDYQLGRNGTPLLIAALPVTTNKPEPIGVVALGISLNWLDYIAETIELPPEGSITVLGPDAEILTHNATQQDAGGNAAPPSKATLQRIASEGNGTLRGEDASGMTRVYGFKSAASGGVVVVVGLPQFVEHSEWTGALIQTLVSPIIVLLLALGAAAWASEAFVVRHVRSLMTTADEIAAGNLDARSDVDYDEHELGQLAASLDIMADAIEESQNELEERSTASEVIAREMQHRIGNSLALVQAIAAQTVRHTKSDKEFIDTFNARLRALSVSNQLLLEDDWKSADLKDLLQTLLTVHGSEQSENFRFDGPSLPIDSRTTLAISLAVHELATNAAKYGALSQAGGQVAIRWSLSGEGDARELVLDWRETGGPRTKTPSQQGFGSQMMQLMIERKLGGRLERTFARGGLTCRIVLPWQKPPEV